MYSHKAYYYIISVSVICYSSCLFSFKENRNCWLFFGKFYFIDFIFNFRLLKWYCRSVVIYNMKRARPWMLANLKIIWQFHAQPVHQKVWRYFGPGYVGDDFFLGPNLVSFNELSFLRDRPFNLKRGGYGFLFRSEFFFGTTRVRLLFFFVTQSAIFFSRIPH
jgi:hypothetical protein